jgi:hypothetical protein
VCQKHNSARIYTPDDGPCETETCCVVVAVEVGHGIGVVKPETTKKAALETVFVYIDIPVIQLQK